jgi:hypothetical protein
LGRAPSARDRAVLCAEHALERRATGLLRDAGDPDLIRNTGMRDWDMHDREERKGIYEQLIRRGLPQQMIRWMDGALLVDVWDELDLPDPVRSEWKWAIRLATEPLRPDPLRFYLTEDPELTSTAWVRGYEPLPPPPPPPPPRRAHFDPRPPP